MNSKKRNAATASLVLAIVLLVIMIHSREEQPKSATGHNDGAKPRVATTLLALQESGEPRGTISEPLHMTGDESTALRRAFMAEFAASNAAARAKGEFLYAGRSVDSATSGRATGFAQGSRPSWCSSRTHRNPPITARYSATSRCLHMCRHVAMCCCSRRSNLRG